MKKLFLLLLLVATSAEAQSVTYIAKNSALKFCGSIYDATTAKRLTAAVTGIDCEYAVTLPGTDESAFADLSTAERVVGAVGQFCGTVTATEDNIDGEVRVSCKASNTNAADWEHTYSTLFQAPYNAITPRGTLQSATATTAVLAATESSADDRYNDRAKLVILSGTGAGESSCIRDYVNSSDTATVDTWPTTPDSTSTYDILSDAGCQIYTTGGAVNTVTTVTNSTGGGRKFQN